jgi:UDP-N-acetylglucosamine 2-epimerase (non-hydrolysing)
MSAARSADAPLRVLHVAGARPNFMKIAPVMAALADEGGVEQRLVHTGQHYDEALSRVFFHELALPQPSVDLGVGSDTHARQTAQVMTAIEPVITDFDPHLVVVVGDVNSTVAAALTAAKLGVPVAHVEAGLRSFDWSMPEEVNRVVTDRLSTLLFTTEASANENLAREGHPDEAVHFVGNVMIDTLLKHRQRAADSAVHERLDLEPDGYVLATLHRPANVDDRHVLQTLLAALATLAVERPVLLPLHPRTRQRLRELELTGAAGAVRLLEPLGYIDFLALQDRAAVVLTDSGGIQEETTALGVPCLTLRPNTERPVTIETGTNRLVPLDTDAIVAAAREAISAGRPAGHLPPPLWDGHAGARIARIIASGSWRGRTPGGPPTR